MDRYLRVLPSEEGAFNSDDAGMLELQRRDAALDEALRCTFPASDPVAIGVLSDAPITPCRGYQRLHVEFFKHAHSRHPT